MVAPMKTGSWKGWSDGLSWVEVLLVLAILLTLVIPVLKVIYGQSMREWEREVLGRLGINPELGWMLGGVFTVAFMTLRSRSRERRGK